MLKFCGDVSFGGYCAPKRIQNRQVKPSTGLHFNFVVRSRIQREDNEEFLFGLHPIFVRDDKTIDEKIAKASIDSYGRPATEEIFEKEPNSEIRADSAFEIAKAYLQKQVGDSIWDWDEDVSLLNVASVVIQQ